MLLSVAIISMYGFKEPRSKRSASPVLSGHRCSHCHSTHQHDLYTTDTQIVVMCRILSLSKVRQQIYASTGQLELRQ